MTRRKPFFLSSLILLLISAGPAPGLEYEVVILPLAPDAVPTFPSAMNEAGTVVGQAGAPLFAWKWDAETGLVVLPPPPGLGSYRAMDVNDDGIIAGDGGIDWGEAWRYSGGVYEMLGTLPGDPMSTAVAINQLGEVAGTSQSPSVIEPRTSYLGDEDGTLIPIIEGSYATRLNDAGQVIGYYTSQRAFRFTPGIGVETLPMLGSRTLSWAFGVNASGSVVGATALPSGNGLIPFLFTDAGGIREIGSFGDATAAVSINDHGVVVGTFAAGGNFPWIWDEVHGIRFLADLIDPATEIHLLTAVQIKNNGWILVTGRDPVTFKTHPVILRPVGSIFQDGFESGDPGAWRLPG